MHRIQIFLQRLLITAALCLINNVQAFEALDSTVAVVEDDVILSSELNQRIEHLSRKQPNIVINDSIKKEVLDQLITEKLQLRIAQRLNLKVSQEDIQTRIDEIKARAQSESISFDEYLIREHLTDSKLRQSIIESIALQRVQEGNVNNRIQVTEREIDEYLSSAAGQDWLKVRFRLSHILLPFDANEDAKSIQKAQQIIRLLKDTNQSFASLAVTYSKGPNASKGGDLGWRAQEQLPSLFVQQVNALQPNQVTAPFRSNAGIHILKLIERGGVEPVMVKQFKVRHILIKPSALFTDKEAKTKADTIYQKIVDGADFEELAREYSEDIGSKQSGGDLSWSRPGQFVPAFEKAMQTTPIGQISDPFRSEFGWHILKVDATRTEDMFDVVKRNQVVSILRQRRFQDELQQWIKELREEAYIEVLI
jgi:peptidyl-prolyl cis-trans isomerase SurA